MGSFRFLGCFDFVRTVQRGWDLLDFLDVLILYALSRGGGIFRFPGCYYFVRAVQRGWDLRFLGCYDFVRAVQRGWDLLDFLDVMTLYALPEGVGSF